MNVLLLIFYFFTRHGTYAHIVYTYGVFYFNLRFIRPTRVYYGIQCRTNNVELLLFRRPRSLRTIECHSGLIREKLLPSRFWRAVYERSTQTSGVLLKVTVLTVLTCRIESVALFIFILLLSYSLFLPKAFPLKRIPRKPFSIYYTNRYFFLLLWIVISHVHIPPILCFVLFFFLSIIRAKSIIWIAKKKKELTKHFIRKQYRFHTRFINII